MRAVILAGGKGTRLAPYTTVLPKPLMPVGDMPILELLIRQLRLSGFDRVTLSVGHLASLLMAFFQDGEALGVSIDYSVEAEPLGTAGPLTLIEGLEEPCLVMNGDLLTDLNFQSMIDFHSSTGAAATVGIFEREIRIDLGVLEISDDHRVVRYQEKPTSRYLASMGVYILDPDVLRYIPRGVRYDLPDLVGELLLQGRHVAGYCHDGYWLDIGRPDDYRQAQVDAPRIQARLLGDTEQPMWSPCDSEIL